MLEKMNGLLILARHGDYDRMSGHLSEKGKADSALLALKVEDFLAHTVSVYASLALLTGDTPRTQETAYFIGRLLSLDAIVLPQLTFPNPPVSPPEHIAIQEAAEAVLAQSTGLDGLIVITHQTMTSKLLPAVHRLGRELRSALYSGANAVDPQGRHYEITPDRGYTIFRS